MQADVWRRDTKWLLLTGETCSSWSNLLFLRFVGEPMKLAANTRMIFKCKLDETAQKNPDLSF